jgi:hypothetical protein
VITRPSTPRVLLDVCDELMRDIMPIVTDPAQQIRLHMLTTVLTNAANAAEREISIMKGETADYLAYAVDVAEATGDPAVRAALDAVQPTASLVLSDVAAEYSRASNAFSTALEAVMDRRDLPLVERGEALLRQRQDLEKSILSGTATAGRSAS